MSILDEIVQHTVKRIKIEKRMFKLPERDLPTLSLRSALCSHASPGIIAEYKRASPRGIINLTLDCEEFVKYTRDYVRGYSVLTEPKWFLGSYTFLRIVKEESGKPTLMKDFVVDPWQIDLAFSIGADVVLLIVKVLGIDKALEFHDYARSLGLDTIIEVDNVNDAIEVSKCIKKGETILGVNSRNLTTLDISIDRCIDIVKAVDYDLIIAESGISRCDDIMKFKDVKTKVKGFLIGTSIMKNIELIKDLHTACSLLY